MFESGSSLGCSWLPFALVFDCGVGGMICRRRCISGVAEQNGSVALSARESCVVRCLGCLSVYGGNLRLMCSGSGGMIVHRGWVGVVWEIDKSWGCWCGMLRMVDVVCGLDAWQGCWCVALVGWKIVNP